MPKIIIALILATVLGFVSPFLASPDDGPILWTWFNWMPMRMDQWLMPAGEANALALDVGVLAAQYLLLFALVAGMRRAGRLVLDFVRAPRHRSSGLVR